MIDQNEKHQTHGTISESYPDIGRIVLFVAFEEADSESEPNYQQIIFTADSEAIFRLDCSRDDCEGGGFDFTPLVDAMVRDGESRIHGTISCEGVLCPWNVQCGLKAEYRIIID